MTNKVTGIMLAAANMEAERIYNNIRARERWPYKADTPEHGLDIARVFAEASQTRGVRLVKDVAILAVSVFGLMHLLHNPSPDELMAGQEPTINWLATLGTLVVVAAIQFFFLKSMRQRARQALQEATDSESTGAVGTSSTDAAADGNVMISGGYSPFVGAGSTVRAWSFTVDLHKSAAESMPVLPVTAQALYAETQTSIEKLQLPRLSISDTVCLDGRDVGEVGGLLPSGRHRKPQPRLPQGEVDKLVGLNDTKMRHYKLLRADLWGGELVVSVFFRYVIQAGLLYVEAKILQLTPLKDEFLEYEKMPTEPDFKEVRDDAIKSLVLAPFLWIGVALRALTFLGGGWAAFLHDPEKANGNAIDRDRKFNYGWPESLREQWASGKYERYFQGVDLDFYQKSIQEALLDSLLTSLKARNVNVENFKEASTTIFNSGVMVSGGTFKADSVAAGSGASAVVNKVLGAAGRAAESHRASAAS
jgi:hypothetical protein